MKMHENSLFAILLRSPWWVSVLVAGGVAGFSGWILSKFDMHPLYAVVTASPFLIIGVAALWRQLRAPSARRIAAGLEALRALPAEEFAVRLEAAYRAQGYEARRAAGGADLELEKSGRIVLVAFRRWKAVRTGVEPLRELDAARRKRDASEAIYLAAGDITDTARRFAAENGIRLLEQAELARLLG